MMRASINGRLYNIVSEQDFQDPIYQTYGNAVLFQNPLTGEQYVLPNRARTDTNPGIYKSGPINFINLPNQDQTQYFLSTGDIVDFNNISNVNEYLQKSQLLQQMEYDLLTSSDNTTFLKIGENDTGIMRGLKEAINSKHFDFDKYADRFGPNYANDKRKLKDKDITLERALRIANNTDIKVTITLEDKSPDVPNPMNKSITVVLTRGEDSSE